MIERLNCVEVGEVGGIARFNCFFTSVRVSREFQAHAAVRSNQFVKYRIQLVE